MQFQTKVKAKSLWTQRKRALVLDALEYANCYLGLYVFDDVVRIRLSGEPHSPGLCCCIDGRIIIKISADQPEEEIVETLFHELTHAKQYLSGALEDFNENVCYWKGHCYKGDFENTESPDYWNAPWEVEARKVGEELRISYYQS